MSFLESFLKHNLKTGGTGPWARLKLVGAGLGFGAVGWALQYRGIQVLRQWTGQPMFSWGLIGTGLLCIAFACIPLSWVAKAAELPRAKTGHHR
jgi:hypothetical protein